MFRYGHYDFLFDTALLYKRFSVFKIFFLLCVYVDRAGNIMDRNFLQEMYQSAQDLRLSTYTTNLLTTLLEEAMCPDHHTLVQSKHGKTGGESKDQSENSKSEQPQCTHSDGSSKRPLEATDDDNVKKQKVEEKEQTDSVPDHRQLSEVEVKEREERLQGCRDCSLCGMPMFFYNLHNRKVRNVDVPR